jgi:hypothetical protein
MGGTTQTPNVNQQTIPMFSPDGTLGDIPIAQISQARAAGAKGAVQVKSPGGDVGWIPADKLKDATSAGGTIVPIHQQETQHPGFWNSVIEDVKGVGQGISTTASALSGDVNAGTEMAMGARNAVVNAPAEWQQRKAAGYSLPYRAAAPVAEAVGVNVPGMEEAARQGDVAGVAGHTVVPAAAAVAPLAAEGVVRGAGAVSDVVADAAKTAVNKTSSAVRAIDPDVVGIVSPRAAHTLKVAQRAAKVAQKYTQAAPVEAASTAAEDFREPGTSPQTESAATSEEQHPVETPAKATAPKPDTSPAAIQQKLNDALGGKALEPNVPLKNQVPARAAPSAATTSLPDGFTPVDSSALKGYKYDSSAREFEYITKDGSHYVRGDVDPSAVETFESNPSPGKGLAALRNDPQGGVGVAKVLNGKRVAIAKAQPLALVEQEPPKSLSDLSGKATPAKAAPATGPKLSNLSGSDEDLTSLLQQSLDQVRQKTTRTDLGQLTTENGKAKVVPAATTAAPSDLADRWGVDEKSLVRSRQQTRGWTPAQTEKKIQELTEAYKSGKTVEPVIEKQDADGNLIGADGRMRVIAAKRAGVKDIPIIVRRLKQ